MSTVSDAEKQQAQDQKAQALQQQYNKYQENITNLQTQLSTLTSQIHEHAIVDKTLSEIAPSERGNRKCFKMIGGVLVDKSVDEVIQILNDETKSLNKEKTQFEQELTKTRKEMESWMKSNNIKIVKGGAQE
mmetsp:Transcript_8928/g.8826  ORF Transcript_8928/g.8826 Transcript_8928/m.8826 type:complete len:132 (-) Transcript_8928:106-501(-)